MSRIAVTGADGFVGSALCSELLEQGHIVDAIGRKNALAPDLVSEHGWLERLDGADIVFHLAARAHITRDRSADPLQEFRRTNVDGTVRVARAAVQAGAKRFVFLSSIGVFGNSSDQPLSEVDPPGPVDAYAVSKWQAEQRLREIEQETGLDVVIVRPPLIYGPHVKGNFLRLLKLISAGVPLPLGQVVNRRSFIGLRNLCDLLSACAVSPAACGQLFVAADGEDVSTAAMVVLIANGLGCQPRLWNVPAPLMLALTAVVRREKDWEKLTCSLVVNAARARAVLGWNPGISVAEGVAEMACWYVRQQRAVRV